MAKELEETAALTGKKSMINPKIFIIGLPLFIVQLVLVYFITANILLSKMQPNGAVAADSLKKGSAGNVKKETAELGKHIFSIDDIIVNPAGTNGQRLLLTSIGFDLPSEEEKKAIETKDAIVKDVIISTLSGKTLSQLSSVTYRDTIKTEITKKLNERIPKMAINSIYFSKYILQ